jgi:hypothetical protein
VLNQDGLGYTGIDLVVTGQDPITGGVVTSGTSVISVLESVNGGAPVQVTDNLDSAGGFGTIPSSLVPGDTIVPAATKLRSPTPPVRSCTATTRPATTGSMRSATARRSSQGRASTAA